MTMRKKKAYKDVDEPDLSRGNRFALRKEL
jgi:hypothetical protein